MAASTPSAPQLGSETTKVDLPEAKFAAEWHEHLVWHTVRNELLERRQGTHSTKTRGQVRGGGAKPWRQKGTGRARQGTRTAPQWSGGGVVFGPTPRLYGGKVNKKERARALAAALSLHAGRGSLAVLSDAAFGEAPSTKLAAEVRSAWSFDARHAKLVVVCSLDQESVWKSFRNLADVMVVPVTDLDVADVLWGRGLLVTESALAYLKGRDA